MKILHTADLHLKVYNDERWQALQQLLDTGAAEQISLLLISGDLFDHGADLLNLQDRVRALFSNLPFTVLVLPGNHDYAAFTGGIYLGGSARVLDDWRQPFQCGAVTVWGLPFEPIGGAEILLRLREMAVRMEPGQINLLLPRRTARRLLLPPGSGRGREQPPCQPAWPILTSFLRLYPGRTFSYQLPVWTLPRQNGRERYFVYPFSGIGYPARNGPAWPIFLRAGRPGNIPSIPSITRRAGQAGPVRGGIDPVEQVRRAQKPALAVPPALDGGRIH